MNSFRLVSFATLLCCFGLTLPATGQEYNDPASRHEVSAEGPTTPGFTLTIPEESVSLAQSNQLTSRNFQPGINVDGVNADNHRTSGDGHSPVEDTQSDCDPQNWDMLSLPSQFMDPTEASNPSGLQLLQLPPVYVHNRQTVPLSKRMAEIWMTFPEGIDAWVSVNYVEYPPEGSVRVFRSSLRHDGSKAYRISARYRTDKGWVYLRATGATVKRELDAHSFEVKVQPGDQVRIAFQ